jgi:hypothetical protein
LIGGLLMCLLIDRDLRFVVLESLGALKCPMPTLT